MAWMETDYSKMTYVLSMKDEMTARAFGRPRNYGWEEPSSKQLDADSRDIFHNVSIYIISTSIYVFVSG